MQAALAWLRSLLARARCTMTWSEHQYQMEEMARPKVIPDQGRSLRPGCASRNKCIASLGTAPHSSVPLAVVVALSLAVARKYLSIKPS